MTYLNFINDIIKTRGRFSCGDKYHEKHHIVPRCMNGTDDEDNLIDLYAKEHYEAHRLLALENPDNEKMDGRYANGNSACCVPIYSPELNESFWGLQEVHDKYGFSKPNLSKCLNGERKHCGKHPVTGEKLTWQRLENN